MNHRNPSGVRPLLRVPVTPLASGQSTLDEATSRYLVRVHRLRSGAAFLAFDPEAASEAEATLLSDRLPHAQVALGEPRPATARPDFALTLLQAVGKGDKPEQVVRDATVLGAVRVVFVETERCVARAAGSARRGREQRVAIEAARQAGRGDLPEIAGPYSFGEALGRVDEGARRLVLCWHERAAPLLAALAGWHEGQELAVLVGPEGGLTPDEVERALAAGFAPVSLGPWVLRTETAATVALGVVRSYADARRP